MEINEFINDQIRKNKYIIYSNRYKSNGDIICIICNNYKYTELDKKFNYYILIDSQKYKLFKKEIYIINNTCSYPLPIMAKFYKSYYNKKNITYNNIKYVKIKLRVFSNSFEHSFELNFDQNLDNHSKRIIYPELNQILIIGVPVKRKYNNIFSLADQDVDNYRSSSPLNHNKLALSEDIDLYIENRFKKVDDKSFFDYIVENFDEIIRDYHNYHVDKKSGITYNYEAIIDHKKYDELLYVDVKINSKMIKKYF